MDNSNNNSAFDVVYDAMENKTYEILDSGVFYAELHGRGPKLSETDTIMEIMPRRFYEGKELNDNSTIDFCAEIISPTLPERTGKIVFVIDGERLEINTLFDRIGRETEYDYWQYVITGTNTGSHLVSRSRQKGFVLQPADIKRIADAKNVGVYIDSQNLYDANGGDIKFRNVKGSFQIEGLRGVMKRVYHYFVDETCYAEYCASFLERKQQLREKEEKEIEQIKEQIKQEKKAEEDAWYRARRKYLIILLASIVFWVILCLVDPDGVYLWLVLIPAGGFLYSTFQLFSIGAIGGRGNAGDGNE